MNAPAKRRLPHFLCGSRPAVLGRAERAYGPVGREYRRRWLKIRLATASLVPWHILEAARFGERSHTPDVEGEDSGRSPVFIIGHWQAGHSLMHELLLTDDQFASVNLLHSVLPACFRTLGAPVSWHLKRKLPRTRGVDTMPLGMQSPQGDDFMLAGLTDLSLYYGYVFPRSYDQVLSRALLFEDVSLAEIDDWKSTYRRALNRVAATQEGKRLVSRNASNTTRIPQILEMYPDARFIHMYRNPWNVFAAQESRLESLTGRWCLQTPNREQFEESTLKFFVTMMDKFYADQEQIPQGQLIEIRYEDLLARPAEMMATVYRTLGLGSIDDEAAATIDRTATRIGELAGHGEMLDKRSKEIVADRWAGMIDRWNYTVPVAE